MSILWLLLMHKVMVKPWFAYDPAECIFLTGLHGLIYLIYICCGLYVKALISLEDILGRPPKLVSFG